MLGPVSGNEAAVSILSRFITLTMPIHVDGGHAISGAVLACLLSRGGAVAASP